MPLTTALTALTTSDQPALERYTRDILHLSPVQEWWPYVAEALWETEHLLPDVTNPVEYLRRVATRIRAEAEQSYLGPQPVRDPHRRIIGTIYLCSYQRPDGSVSETMLEARVQEEESASPRPRPTFCDELSARIPWVETDDADERDLQRLLLRGVRLADADTILGWTAHAVRAVYMRLYRRRVRSCKRESGGTG